MTGYRLQHQNDKKRISFTFDGKQYSGVEGDTLASALLANGVKLFARSFKYHRPRGVLSAGSEEPNALCEVLHPDGVEANTPMTMLEIYDGLVARSQNRFPSLSFDLQAVNELLSPLFGAGFYYKTFMGTSNKHWMFFEKFIRRAAGMGKADTNPDQSRYIKKNVFCDVLVVGGGLSGLYAAEIAANSGARVVLVDENNEFGGRYRSYKDDAVGFAHSTFIDEKIQSLQAMENVTLLKRTTLYGYYDDNTLGAIERVSDHLSHSARAKLPRQCHHVIRAGKVVLATGALERPMIFENNDRAGVMLASAITAYCARFGVLAGREIVLYTNNDSLYDEVRQLYLLGAKIKTIIDVRSELTQKAKVVQESYDFDIIRGAHIKKAIGRQSIKAIELNNGLRISCDVLGMSAGWTPQVNLQSQKGDKPVYDEAICSYVARQYSDDYISIGGCDGRFSIAQMFDQTYDKMSALLDKMGFTPQSKEPVEVAADQQDYLIEAFFQCDHANGKQFVDFQHDVKVSDLALAKQEGYVSVEHLKRYTTLGMATDQGKTSNANALHIMSKLRGMPLNEVGTTRFRAPYTPVSIGALSGGEYGAHFRPTRKTPMHDWHLKHGAEMINTGAWVRPRVYKKAGETVVDAYIREARGVRESVGMVDVTTLGKIEIIGPDAAEFLNRVYTNAWLKLPVGKARYGVMLREDGHVFDDGTTWRLDENRFLMTTTTANAAAVLLHLEYYLDIVWTDLKVKVVSVTEQWAGLALAGPNSRKVLEKILSDVDMSNDAFPFMAVMDATLGEIPVKVARLSFSGELAYEVWCASHFGYEMWDQIYQAGLEFDIVPYGTEALGTLRIEKGHVSGPELDGRTTLDDLGLSWAWGKKDFIGKPLAQRAGLQDPKRKKLVGLISKEGKAIRSGSQIILSKGSESAKKPQGHVTSTTYSPALGKYIALALISEGRDKINQTVYATYPLKDEIQEVEIVEPHFFDPEGSRMHV